MPRSSKGEKEKHRRAVAKGVALGEKTVAIARTIARSQRNVQRLAKEPETEFLVREIMRPHHARLRRLVPKAITAVEGGLGARTRLGNPIHEMRLRAVGRFGQLLHLAEGNVPPDAGSPGICTWEEFLVIYHRRTDAEHTGA